MTTGENLLNLTIEYQQAKAAVDAGQLAPGRTPEEIAAEYEQALKTLANGSAISMNLALG